MKYKNDNRIVLTLDAGGTNFVFSAIKGNEEIVEPLRVNANPHDLNLCLNSIKSGFQRLIDTIEKKPVAISFAFPGPADYERGIIGDLPNFPAFRGGVALGPMLENEFEIPVFINNDGSLFAYGEALAGVLPGINKKLEATGRTKKYKNLYGATFGTGFGGGAVINNELLVGDNSCGGDIWCFRNKKQPDYIAETGVSIRAVKQLYKKLSGDKRNLEPKDIYEIAEGTKEGSVEMAQKAFSILGEVAGDAISQANTIVDGLVVIGGGLSGAAKYILPSLVKEMNSIIKNDDESSFPRQQSKAYDLTNPEELDQFLNSKVVEIPIPGTDKTIAYESERKTGVLISEIGTSKAIALGAYAFALHKLDIKE